MFRYSSIHSCAETLLRIPWWVIKPQNWSEFPFWNGEHVYLGDDRRANLMQKDQPYSPLSLKKASGDCPLSQVITSYLIFCNQKATCIHSYFTPNKPQMIWHQITFHNQGLDLIRVNVCLTLWTLGQPHHWIEFTSSSNGHNIHEMF